MLSTPEAEQQHLSLGGATTGFDVSARELPILKRNPEKRQTRIGEPQAQSLEARRRARTGPATRVMEIRRQKLQKGEEKNLASAGPAVGPKPE